MSGKINSNKVVWIENVSIMMCEDLWMSFKSLKRYLSYPWCDIPCVRGASGLILIKQLVVISLFFSLDLQHMYQELKI